ncbi:hypothetical protein [Neolewinella antarctica]|uniref:Uncharacterized protein n=1 Tax=Neolewinella antarctica TaxID=442734 RepID=A0ABX0XDB3_9BACT|nr:hypothetical protein [Neolewinella antarctica]NJC27192.1 hypothetical protein [Neolewinella antarctica]
MTPRYTYQSEHQAAGQHRWIHFLQFAGAFLLLLAGLYELYLFFTDWTATEEDHSYWHLVFALIYLAISALLAYSGTQHVGHSADPAERFVRIDDKKLSWSLHQQPETEEVALTNIASFTQPNVRDLRLVLVGGGEKVLPIYLISDQEKQEELVDVLRKLVAKG